MQAIFREKIQSYFTRTQSLTYSGKSEVQQEQKTIASVGNCILSAQRSSNFAIATSLPSDEEIRDKSAPVPPNICPLKTEDYSGSDVATLVKCEDSCPEVDRSSIWITHNGRHSLNENERLIIEQGCELND